MSDPQAAAAGAGFAIIKLAIVSPEILHGAGSLVYGGLGAIGAIIVNESYKALKGWWQNKKSKNKTRR